MECMEQYTENNYYARFDTAITAVEKHTLQGRVDQCQVHFFLMKIEGVSLLFIRKGVFIVINTLS